MTEEIEITESAKSTLPSLDRDEALSRSVQSFPVSPVTTFVFQLAITADEAPRWWSPRRDAYLDKFWATEPFLAGAIYSVASRNASFRYELTGPIDEVRWAQQLLSQADFGEGWQSFLMKVTQDLLCLGYESSISLGGDRRGKRKTIQEIVRDQDTGPVLTVEADGSLSERYITGWYENKLGDRRWNWLRLKNTSHRQGTKKGGLWLTHDHKVLTPTGWVEVCQLEKGDRVLTRYPMPTVSHMPLLVGMMLGDGSMYQRGRLSSTFMSLGHSARQREWMTLKRNSLRGFGWSPICENKRRSGYNSLSSNGHCSPGLADLYGAWYKDGKKRVARDLVEKYFTPMMLATWFCDDGGKAPNYSRTVKGKENRPGINLATHGFSKEDTEWLVEKLETIGIEAKVYTSKPKGRRRYWFIRLGVDATEQLARIISPYVPPTMRYKLPKHIDLKPFDPSLWDLEEPDSFVDVVEERVEKPFRTGYTGVRKTAYCIDVEGTGNFCASDVVVHNCMGNGAFIEIIRPAKARYHGKSYDAVRFPDETTQEHTWHAFDRHTGKLHSQLDWDFKVADDPRSLPVGIAHLDSRRCERSGNPDYPVIFQDLSGIRHTLAWHQVITLSEMPSPRAEHYGVQHSAVDRVFKLAQVLRDLQTYKQEKISGRFARAIHLTNVDPQVIQDAIDQAEENADSRGLLRYMQPIIAATLDPNATPGVSTLELASLPDGFNEETIMRWYIAGLASVLGVDYGFLAPLPGSKLGTAAQAETQERQARGKSSRLFMNMLAHKFNYSGILPNSVSFRFSQSDPYVESEKDRAFARRTRARSTAIRSGEITPQIARQMACDIGDLDPKYLAMLGERDLSPIITVSGDEMIRDYSEYEPRYRTLRVGEVEE